MRDKIIRILWLDPINVDAAIESETSLNPGLYYITRIAVIGTNFGCGVGVIFQTLDEHDALAVLGFHRDEVGSFRLLGSMAGDIVDALVLVQFSNNKVTDLMLFSPGLACPLPRPRPESNSAEDGGHYRK